MADARTNTRRDHQLRADFFQEGKELDAAGDPEADCWLCHTQIDYQANPGSTPDSHSLDHYYPVSTHPELQSDPDNFRHAHLLCNEQRGNGDPAPPLGDTIPDWW